MKTSEIGIITEVGDLGLGFEELSEEDKKKLKEAEQEDKK